MKPAPTMSPANAKNSGKSVKNRNQQRDDQGNDEYEIRSRTKDPAAVLGDAFILTEQISQVAVWLKDARPALRLHELFAPRQDAGEQRSESVNRHPISDFAKPSRIFPFEPD